MIAAADTRVLFLSGDEVARALPDVEERLELAARAMRSLVGDAELPPKIGVHPRPNASFAHAMPAFVRGSDTDGAQDLLGLKWVSGFPANATRGMPAISATILLSNPVTGRVHAVLDGGGLTAHRTAGVSGVAIRAWLAGRAAESRLRVAIVGAGVQARSHLPVLALLLPGSALVVADRHAERAAQVTREADASGAFESTDSLSDPAAAVNGADVVLTMIAFGQERQLVPASAFESAQLIVAVDYDMCVPAVVAQRAASGRRFVVDERGQFLANRSGAVFAGYPDPSATLGELFVGAEDGGGGNRDGGEDGSGEDGGGAGAAIPGTVGAPALVTHLGVGVADLVFADAVVRQAHELGLGTRVGGGTT